MVHSSPRDRLRLYTALLERAAAHSHDEQGVDLWRSNEEMRATTELKHAGFLSDGLGIGPHSAAQSMFARPLVVTPAGAVALVEWRDLMHQRTVAGRLLRLLEVLLPAAVGSALTVVGQMLL